MKISKKFARVRALPVILAVILALSVMPIASAATINLNITAPAGGASYSFTQRIVVNESRSYSGIQFELTVSDPAYLVLNSYSRTGSAVTGATDMPFRKTGDNTYAFGFYTASNAYSGNLDIGALNLTYSGNEPQYFTLSVIKFAYFPDDGDTSDWFRIENDYIRVDITRATVTPPDEGGNPPPPGGGIPAPPPEPPPIIIEEEGPPLIGMESFAPFINGYTDATFRGDTNMTRQEFATILYKIKNPDDLPVADTDDPSFEDVAPGRWSYDAIEWLVAAEAVDPGGKFRPTDKITRAEVAEMLARADKLTEMADNIFSDIENHPARDYILMGVNTGVFEGYPDGTFRPDNNMTRYALVAAMVRYLLGGEPTEDMWEDIDFKLVDVPQSHWAYRYVALATAGYVAIPPTEE